MASGSSGRVNSGSKDFNFGSDDILSSYNDFTNNDSNFDATNSNKEFHKTRMARSSVFPTSSYAPPEDSLREELTFIVERSMKKCIGLFKFLEINKSGYSEGAGEASTCVERFILLVSLSTR
ncbi:unnamed protein product [Eruca vesicaria subsp. sativa]|uniref:Uncharacterized protein n=1 Tax=Eruca vesicaria subsp. sativa TaxID=29727 RepID=A0ABC8J693_ERUVS|nr:unnamed protein product [Eruca vesicaria subsp. sativa]